MPCCNFLSSNCCKEHGPGQNSPSHSCSQPLRSRGFGRRVDLALEHCLCEFQQPSVVQNVAQETVHHRSRPPLHWRKSYHVLLTLYHQHHFTTGSADTVLSDRSPLLVFVSSSFSFFSWFSSAAVLSALKKILALLSEKYSNSNSCR